MMPLGWAIAVLPWVVAQHVPGVVVVESHYQMEGAGLGRRAG